MDQASYHLIHVPENRPGKWESGGKGKTDDDICGVCGVQKTGCHLVLDCRRSQESVHGRS